MSRHRARHTAGLVTVAFVFVSLASLTHVMRAATVVAAQPTAADRAMTATPTTLGLTTITGDFTYFAGEYIRIPKARVREVISPRLFTVEPATMPRSYIRDKRDDSRALVVLAKPVADLKQGAVVEIIGRPWTFEGAQTHVTGGWIDDLDSGERKHFETKAVIGADIVRIPGSAELYSGK
jgi:hypothetical protein